MDSDTTQAFVLVEKRLEAMLAEILELRKRVRALERERQSTVEIQLPVEEKK